MAECPAPICRTCQKSIVACECSYSFWPNAAAADERIASLEAAIDFALTEHNLLRFIADGECGCDYEVGMFPCETCAAVDIIRKLEEIRNV